MPRPQFFKDLNTRHVSQECKEHRHEDCDGWWYPPEWNQHQRECACTCHLTAAQLARLRIKRIIKSDEEDKMENA